MFGNFIIGKVGPHELDIHANLSTTRNCNQGQLMRMRQVEAEVEGVLPRSQAGLSEGSQVELQAGRIRLQITGQNRSQASSRHNKAVAVAFKFKAGSAFSIIL